MLFWSLGNARQILFIIKIPNWPLNPMTKPFTSFKVNLKILYNTRASERDDIFSVCVKIFNQFIHSLGKKNPCIKNKAKKWNLI